MEKTISTSLELEEYIKRVGFLPYSTNVIPGLSLDELTLCGDTPMNNAGPLHPYLWRETMCSNGETTCGRYLSKKLAFISREWIPHLANYRRNGKDFDTLYRDGYASHKAKLIMDAIESEGPKSTAELKAICGKGFDTVFATLQMQLFVTAHHYQYKTDKNGKEYGWALAYYTTAEEQFGHDFVTSKHHLEPRESMNTMIRHMQSIFPHIENESLKHFFS